MKLLPMEELNLVWVLVLPLSDLEATHGCSNQQNYLQSCILSMAALVEKTQGFQCEKLGFDQCKHAF